MVSRLLMVVGSWLLFIVPLACWAWKSDIYRSQSSACNLVTPDTTGFGGKAVK